MGKMFSFERRYYCTTGDGRLFTRTVKDWKTKPAPVWRELHEKKLCEVEGCEPVCCVERDLEVVRGELIEALEKEMPADLVEHVDRVVYVQQRLGCQLGQAMSIVRKVSNR